MMVAKKALSYWGLDDATVTLVAARENRVYCVEHKTGTFALRLHRVGYRTDKQLTSELDWMAWLKKSGLSVPSPKVSLTGSRLQIVDGVQVDVLNWLTGNTLDETLPNLDASERIQIVHTLGQNIAKLHIASDAWPDAEACNRPVWDVDGLVGESPLWDRFWENPSLTAEQSRLFRAFRQKARNDLSAFSSSLDYGLIHADLVPNNIMIDGDAIHLIDFDDGGFGFRLFEIATVLLKLRAWDSYEALKAALLSGYRTQKPLDATYLDLFLALRAMTYVGWNITRLKEDKTGERNTRFIDQATELAVSYLEL